MILTINVNTTVYSSSALLPLVVDVGGIVIGTNISAASASLFAASVTDNTAIDISVTKTGYYPYSITIDNVYAADKSINIVLQEIVPLNNNTPWLFYDNEFMSGGKFGMVTNDPIAPNFSVGDVIFVTQDPGFDHIQYEGQHTIASVGLITSGVSTGKYAIGTTTPRVGNSAVNGGSVVKVNAHPYGNIYPDMFHFLDMCSFKADYYSANSGDISQSSWYVNNILYSTGTKTKIDFIYPGTYQVKHVVENADWLKAFATTLQGNTVLNKTKQPIGNYLVLDTATNVSIAEYRPDLSLGFTTPNKPLASTDLSCYALGETITITPTWTLNRPGAVANNHTIVYTIMDPDGMFLIPNDISGSAKDTFPLSTTPANATVTFKLSKLGTYKISATIKDDDCGTEFPIEYCVETCKFINIKYKDCNTYTIENKSSVNDVIYSIEQHGVVGTVATGTLSKNTNVDITFSNPGLFIMTATYGAGVTEKYIISNHCEVENCITGYITDLLCGGNDPCAPCPEDSELNQMLLMSYTYFMKLNKEYSLNNFYTGLSQEKLDELTTISGILNKMSLFCSRRKCSDTSFSEISSNAGKVHTWISSTSSCGCKGSCNCNVKTSSSGCSSC